MAKMTPKEVEKGKKAVEREAAKAEAEAKPSRNRGVTTGMRIWEFQNKSLEDNVKRKLTDEQLAAEWHEEFPYAMDFTERVGMVQTVRSLYNKGKHKNDEPATALVAYDENKKPLPPPTRGRKKAEEVEEEEEAPAPKKAAPAPVKKLKSVK